MFSSETLDTSILWGYPREQAVPRALRCPRCPRCPVFPENTGGSTEGSASTPLDMGEEDIGVDIGEDIEEHVQGHTKEGPWVLWAHLDTEGSPGSLEVTATHSSRKSYTLIMVINSGEGNQAQICAPSSLSTKAKPLGKGKSESDSQRVEIPGLLPTIRARRCWNIPG